jgi:5-methylcytosine-specific restriction protein A
LVTTESESAILREFLEDFFDTVPEYLYYRSMDQLAALETAVAKLRGAWANGSPATTPAELGRTRLVTVNAALGALQRQVDALRASMSAEIARESRPELGAESLAKQQGFRNPVALISATTGVGPGEAKRLIAVGQAIAPRPTLTGDTAPPRHPHVADAVNAGRIGRDAAAAIISMLDRVAIRADREASDRVEALLAQQAEGLALDQLAKVIARAEAHLDPDGLEPKERDARGERHLRMYERDGMLHFDGATDIETGAPVKTAIEAIVTAQFRAAADNDNPDEDLRSVPQRQADALALLAQHYLGCDDQETPLGGATVVVRVALEDLEAGTGHATIDGIAQPVTIGAARRMAADGGIIPCVLGSESDILDWGRERRLFTKAQKLALAERDGGCAMCGLSVGMTKVHHLRWWARDAGPTDLSNGALLCESCHHRIHDNGWEIRIDGTGIRARVWFIPPPHVDPDRRPRLGGRARFDFVAA